ncbi:MAG: TolC family protein [Muribaculaceae bacterium]|nr:TolC family protein [Muribaculaceae bacterium]
MKLIKTTYIAVALVGTTALTGCHMKKFDISRQESTLAKEYAKAAQAPVDSAAFGNVRWEQVFTDPLLADLIREALAANVDLDNARLNVEIARANMRGARLAYLPSLALAPQGGASSVSNGKLTNWNYTIPLTASWEVDIFGKTLNNKRAAEASYRMSQDYAQAVRSQIIGGVANCYYAIAALQATLDMMQETAAIWKENVATMRDYKAIARTNEAAVMQSEANYYSILASIQDIRTQLHETNNSLALLLRRQPQIFAIPALESFAPPVMALEGVDMAMLASRPDVRAAEESLAAAYYQTNYARAAFYPGLTITANYGFTNSFGSIIKNPGDWIASLAGSLVAPIFMRGQNIARLEAAKAQQKQALNNFEKSVLSAASEVSNALTLYENNRQKAVYLDSQVEDLKKAQEYTGDLFAAGSATYLEVLTAQTSLLSARTGRINCELAQAQAVINLYQSLGGGR